MYYMMSNVSAESLCTENSLSAEDFFRFFNNVHKFNVLLCIHVWNHKIRLCTFFCSCAVCLPVCNKMGLIKSHVSNIKRNPFFSSHHSAISNLLLARWMARECCEWWCCGLMRSGWYLPHEHSYQYHRRAQHNACVY